LQGNKGPATTAKEEENMMDIGTVLRGLYASEIPASVSWEKGGRILWAVGIDEWGYPGEEAESLSPEQAAEAMHEAALKLYPDSLYAKRKKEL
jgi:hypothetical protein